MRVTRLSLAALALLALQLLPTSASAQITQPNGVVYPVNSNNGEVQLFTLFTNRGEGVDWVNDASEQPNAFSPLCDFTATLVLKQSGSSLNVGWYNVTGSAPSAAEIYPIFAGPLGNGAVGMTVTGQTIRESSNYAGGLIGFALIRASAPDYYFTERQYNPLCNAGACAATPGRWIMSLSYQSTVTPNAFYVAFEDGDATASGWSNDGDYNDYVFFFTGITCSGAGETCDVPGAQGICAQGLTQCAGAALECIPVNVMTAETCDGLDNDCDGTVDNGDLCASGTVCTNGQCIGRCEEFGCVNPALTCDSATGRCYEAACENVSCPSGQVCRAGQCVGPCSGVICPGDQVCRVGACVDPCANVTCGAMKACQGGVCVDSCACSGCGAGLSCEAASGLCRDPDCVGVTCGAGTVCSPADGTCADACQGAVCPTGQMCTMGGCADIPPVTVDAGTGGNPDGGGTGNLDGGGTGADGGGSGGDQGTRPRGPISSGCGCRVPAPGGPDAPAGLALGLLALGLATRRRKR